MRKFFAISVLAACVPAGCTKPDAANIVLRKENAQLRERMTALEASQTDNQRTITVLETASTKPALADAQIDELFTTHALKFGRLTGWAAWQDGAAAVSGVKVYIAPTDAAGDVLKAAGAFEVELFDLSSKETRLGSWRFPSTDASRLWNGQGLLNCYVLPCPLSDSPTNSDVTVRVTFTDSLTRRPIVTQKQITLRR